MSSLVRLFASAAAVVLLSATAATAAEIKAGDLVISQAWSRATPGGAKVAGGFLTIENKGSSADRLVSGTADIAGKIEIHEMSMDNGVMKMRPLDKGLPIEPGKTVTLMPGSYHIMLMGLQHPLKAGDSFPLTLTFEHAKPITTTVKVEAGAGGMQNKLHLLARRIVVPHPRGGVIDVSAPLPPHMRQSWSLLGFDAARYDPIEEAPEE